MRQSFPKRLFHFSDLYKIYRSIQYWFTRIYFFKYTEWRGCGWTKDNISRKVTIYVSEKVNNVAYCHLADLSWCIKIYLLIFTWRIYIWTWNQEAVAGVVLPRKAKPRLFIVAYFFCINKYVEQIRNTNKRPTWQRKLSCIVQKTCFGDIPIPTWARPL